MAFQIKDFASIVASCINWMKTATTKINDYNTGSVARTLIEAPAGEIDQLYMQMYIGLKESIPVSVYNSFDFGLLTAQPAAGLVRVVITSAATPTLIPAGTTFTTPGKSAPYVSTADVTIAAGSTFGDAPVSCSTAGAAGNVAVGSAFTPAPPPPGYVSASNVSAFVSGQDDEADDERKLRFNSYIQSLHRSTMDALVYGAASATVTDSVGNVTEKVFNAIPVEPYVLDASQPVAWVKLYVHNGVGVTSASLVSAVAKIIAGYVDATTGLAIPGYKAAGVKVDVLAAGDQTVAVTGVVTSAPGYDHPTIVTAATNAISAYLSALPIGKACIFAKLIDLVMSIDGVSNFILSTPTADVTPASTTKLLPGALAIT